MAIRDDKMDPAGGTIRSDYVLAMAPASNLTADIVRIIQVPYSFLVTRVQGWCRTLAGAVTANPGIVRPGDTVQGVTMTIAATKTKFKISAAFDAVMPIGSITQLGNLPALVHKAITDNLAFSTAFTVNADAGTGQTYWGACRVQMTGAGTVSTLVVDSDQAYNTEAEALAACPAAASNQLDCGTITFEAKSGQTFTAGTTDLDNATVLNDVNYNGVSAGFVTVLADAVSAPITYASATVDTGVLVTAPASRAVAQDGGLLVVKVTSDGSGALTDGTLDLGIRVWPANGEVASQGT